MLVAHPGTQHSFRLAVELHRRDALLVFYTGLAFSSDGLAERVWRVLPSRWRRRLANRRIVGVPPERLHCRPIGELAALWRQYMGLRSDEIFFRRNGRFQVLVPDHAIMSASTVIGFDTAAWILAKRCSEFSVPLVLDQSTPHPDAKPPIYALAQQRYPQWTDGVEARSPELRAAEKMEHDGAARVVAASSYTRRTLMQHGVAAAKIRVNPYGVDCERFRVRERRESQPLRFLFVGAVNARKGVPLLIEAWRCLNAAKAELWLVGGASKQALSLLPELPGFRYFGAVPHGDVAELIRQCDVFVFPSYFEGFGLVLLEAMACGLPVITTTATAGPDIVTEGEDGWIIEPGDCAALVDRMNYCLEHPQVVREMGVQARATAQRFTWSAYGDRWMQILAEVCG